MKKIGIGIIGFGTVGTGVVKILKKNRVSLRQRTGADLELKKIVDLDIKTDRGVKLPNGILTKDAEGLLNDPDIDIVVELIGRIEPAKKFILKALNNGKHVITANKALLAEHGLEIYRAAAKNSVDVAFEASVAGGIPIIRAMQESFVSDRVIGFSGILNGTSNYILSRMTDEGGEFKDILKDAQNQGYAEADPTFDIEGVDAAHKLAVLASLAFGRDVSMKKIYTEGISKITPLDIAFARELGYRVKLLAVCRGSEQEIEARVHPTLIPEKHLLSNVNGAFNAVFVQTKDVGPTMCYGKGAGMMPTGSAVVADIVSLARNIAHGITNRVPAPPYAANKMPAIKITPVKETVSKYYLRFSAIDKPGVLSKISGILGRNSISIYSVVQRGRHIHGGMVQIFMLTHEAKEADLQKALKEIDRLAMMKNKTMVIRIEDSEL